MNKSTKLYNIRTKVGALIDVDLNLKHSKLEPPIQTIKKDIWTNRIHNNGDSSIPPPSSKTKKDNNLSLCCISNIFKCIITDNK